MNQDVNFVPGQRWISDTEPDLGLGVIRDVDHRTVTVAFNASAETRRYARAAAPLSRLILKPGDSVSIADMETEIVDVIETGTGIVVYQVIDQDGQHHPVPEQMLPDNLSMNRPLDRLLAGQFDAARWFYLKQQSLHLLGEAEASGLMGLCSARAELIPHQLYIADEVARRYAPRVMLADEVGLGKTIEAGLILQQQLVSGLVQRALIVVPEPLLHQWLVEMLRRFNLQFSLLDQHRCQALQESGETNPFTSAQLVLSPLNLFTDHPQWMAAASEAGWDLCIVDEAHHIVLGTADSVGEETAPHTDSEDDTPYAALARLASVTKGLLLLTATPEQMGEHNFFALLRLLDPARFNDFAAFQAEQQNYRQVAAEIRAMPDTPDREQRARALLDQQGTGRILFRNTRRLLSGFPQRRLFEWPLQGNGARSASEPAADARAGTNDVATNEPQLDINDPKIDWLAEQLTHKNGSLRDGKVLLICADDNLAIALEKHLRLRVGIRTAVFHRQMSLLERDRAAAYFASDDNAARILVCSEIGSEGRNFQFCRHLVLYDLPLNPELLEQRIGRLDRIGQRHDIHIHVPYLCDSAEEVRVRWYNEGLNALAAVAPGAYQLWQRHTHTLMTFLASPPSDAEQKAAFDAFLATVATDRRALQQSLEQGRDQLLERNSFNAERASQLLADIQAFEQQCNPQDWLLNVLDSYSVFHDANTDGSVNIIPGEDMLLPAFPGLPEEGLQACFTRELALRREDRAYLSWQHPMITGALDLTLDSHEGKAAVSVLSGGQTLAAHSESPLMVECLFRLKVTAPTHLQLSRHLPATGFTLTLALDQHGEPGVVPALVEDYFSEQPALLTPDKGSGREALQQHHRALLRLLEHAGTLATKRSRRLLEEATRTMLATQTEEIKRLLALKQRNPNIRQEEIDFLKEQTLALHQCLSAGEPELLAIHVILEPDSL